uniref:PCRF domain-containing protein n=1 Tax=candidate division WWE3 bacterium TaxID=2053526 RepID=A0A832E231_UNCKA
MYQTIILEIRAGTGGDEAGLFAADLYRMYTRFSQNRDWKVRELDHTYGGIGNLKSVVAEISGEGAFDVLKDETGVHRVQRIPKTERGGRIHTSTATVAILPKVPPKEVEINPAHLKIDTFRASGHGGQNIQKVETAVRITHLPTGVVVACQDERSQIQNREKALEIIRAKLYQMLQDQQKTSVDQLRRGQVGGAERSEKIRTWNFPQDRITDHRFGVKVGNLELVLEGNLDTLIDKISKAKAPKGS